MLEKPLQQDENGHFWRTSSCPCLSPVKQLVLHHFLEVRGGEMYGSMGKAVCLGNCAGSEISYTVWAGLDKRFSNTEDVKPCRVQISNLHFGFEQCPTKAPREGRWRAPWQSLPVHPQHVPWVTGVLFSIRVESFAPVKLPVMRHVCVVLCGWRPLLAWG